MHKSIEIDMLDESQLNHGKTFTALAQTMDEELDEEAKKLEKKQKNQLIKLKKESLAQYAIKGDDNDWTKALKSGQKSIVSVKVGEKRGADTVDKDEEKDVGPGWNKNKKKKFQPQDRHGRKDKFFK